MKKNWTLCYLSRINVSSIPFRSSLFRFYWTIFNKPKCTNWNSKGGQINIKKDLLLALKRKRLFSEKRWSFAFYLRQLRVVHVGMFVLLKQKVTKTILLCFSYSFLMTLLASVLTPFFLFVSLQWVHILCSWSANEIRFISINIH